jgi:hypothetical protein
VSSQPLDLGYKWDLPRARKLFLGWTGGDDHALDAIVGFLGKNTASGELVFGGVGTTVDDALGVSVADSGKSLDLVGSGCINVERGGSGSSGLSRLSNGMRRHGEGGSCSDQQGENEQLGAKIQHG